ncbi:DUF262 domain-containing protein [Acidithiobacillus thiooxidans]|uniref:GmrSD restriction endonuclease domain-containing protein n=1 Tax=Acidithiobacillus thiooxidans TaxID=930 RepID=UPI001C079925|nr:DUF262 domain-containing protein [Acidithiobacillus thiooxidans]MBU2793117.1 DUF262 domain-containing protein [Acidithiobacillus thiooxidans]
MNNDNANSGIGENLLLLDSDDDPDIAGIDDDDEGVDDIGCDEKGPIVDRADRTVDDLCRSIEKNKVNLNPDWQRRFVWKPEQQSKLIDSIIYGYPLPAIFMVKRPEGFGWDVVDGVQRLTTISSFASGKLRLDKRCVNSEIAGKTYSELTLAQQSAFDETTIRCFLLQDGSNRSFLFKLFERLNTGGTQLNSTEIQNCIFSGKLFSAIKERFVNDDFFVKCLGGKNGKIHNRITKRMDDIFIVLRFLLFYEYTPSAYIEWHKRGNVTTVKSAVHEKLLKAHQDADNDVIDVWYKGFKLACQNAYTLFGEKAFVISQRASINKGLAYMMLTMLAYEERGYVTTNADSIRERMAVVKQDKIFLSALKVNTSDPAGIKYVSEKLKWVILGNDSNDISRRAAGEARFFHLGLREKLFNESNTCKICGQKIVSIDDAEVDHIFPYSKGGLTTYDNAQLVHRFCNASKGNVI